ncbi:Uncharacterised protein [uncultured Clostridium sp.]|nr:Uncharacterised protein [uncultured Clostridium sp.]
MNGQQLAPICAGFAVAVVLFLVIGYFLRKRNMTAHLAPVKRELKKEKQWLRRGEYNAAMVKGRQNLELFLKLVAEFNGIELDNSAQAMANAKNGPDRRGQRETYRMNGRKRQRVMTFQQFGWWLDENGYLDRVGKWELNEIRVIGNKAVHENYDSREDAWNQYNYMEDLLKIVSDRHTNRHRQRGPEIKKSQTGHRGAGVKKPSGTQAKARGQQNQKHGQNRTQGQTGKGSQGQLKNGSQKQSKNSSQGQPENSGQKQPQKSDGGNKSGDQNGQNVQPEKLSASAKRRQRRKRAKAAREVAEAAGLKRETAPQEKAEKQPGSRPVRAEGKVVKQSGSRPAQPSTSMRIVTLSQTTGGRTASKPMPQREDPAKQPKRKEVGKQAAKQPEQKEAEKQAAKQPKNEETGKQSARRRRRPRKRPASENAGKTAGRSAAGGGDHEE